MSLFALNLNQAMCRFSKLIRNTTTRNTPILIRTIQISPRTEPEQSANITKKAAILLTTEQCIVIWDNFRAIVQLILGLHLSF